MDTKDCGPIEVRQFAWADIEGKGRYALVDVWDTGGKAEGIGIYQKISSARVQESEGDLTPAIPGYTTQSIDIDGYGYEGRLADEIRDLNGDGKKELLVNSGFEIGRNIRAHGTLAVPQHLHDQGDGKANWTVNALTGFVSEPEQCV